MGFNFQNSAKNAKKNFELTVGLNLNFWQKKQNCVMSIFLSNFKIFTQLTNFR